jgi:hypothetical protein
VFENNKTVTLKIAENDHVLCPKAYNYNNNENEPFPERG